MEPRDQSHDKSAKVLFDGVTIPSCLAVQAELGVALDDIFAHPDVPPFIATCLIRSLVTSNPSSAYIKRVADVFANNGTGVRGDLATVLVASLTDPEARQDDPTPEQGHLKDPVNHVISLVRALGGQVNDATQFLYVFENLGERVLVSPTVFSFYSLLAGVPGDPSLHGPEFQIYSPALACQFARELDGQCYALGKAPSLPLRGCDVAKCECHYTNLEDRRSGIERCCGNERRDQIRFEDREDRRSGKDRRSKDHYDWRFTA